MSLQVNNGNQQTGIQVLDQMDPPPYHCIAPSCYPTYIANIPAASPAWNNYNVAPQSITSANLHQWNVHPPSTVLSMPQSQNDFPQNTDLILFQEAFRKGKPKVTGGVLVVLAFLQAGIGIGFLFTIENFTWKSYISFWGLMFYIFTGTLTIRTREKVKIHQVKCSLTFSILTTLISLTAMILISIDYTYTECYFTGSNSYYQACLQNRMPSLAVLSVMFVLNLVLFCVSISISAFSCRALCNLHANSQVFILYNGALYPMSLETIPSAPSEFSSPHLPPPY